jgi:hypothetical protein
VATRALRLSGRILHGQLERFADLRLDSELELDADQTLIQFVNSADQRSSQCIHALRQRANTAAEVRKQDQHDS